MSDHSYADELAELRNMAADLDGFAGQEFHGTAASGGTAETDRMTYELDARQETESVEITVDRFPEAADRLIQRVLTQRGYAERLPDDGFVVHADPGMDEPYLSAWTVPGDGARSADIYLEGEEVLKTAAEIADELDATSY